MGSIFVFRSFFDMPVKATKFYAKDDSGVAIHPRSTSTVEPDQRIFHFTHQTMAKYFAGRHLASLMACFESNLRRRVIVFQKDSSWTQFPCLFALLQSEMFRAVVNAMCGEYLLSANPEFVRDFWIVDRYNPYFMKQYPKWLLPTATKARRRCIEAIKKWHVYAKKHSSEEPVDANCSIDPWYGTKMMRIRQEYSSKMKSLDADALASTDYGLIFG